jgi:hypothetical protein
MRAKACLDNIVCSHVTLQKLRLHTCLHIYRAYSMAVGKGSVVMSLGRGQTLYIKASGSAIRRMRMRMVMRLTLVSVDGSIPLGVQ